MRFIGEEERRIAMLGNAGILMYWHQMLPVHESVVVTWSGTIQFAVAVVIILLQGILLLKGSQTS